MIRKEDEGDFVRKKSSADPSRAARVFFFFSFFPFWQSRARTRRTIWKGGRRSWSIATSNSFRTDDVSTESLSSSNNSKGEDEL